MMRSLLRRLWALRSNGVVAIAMGSGLGHLGALAAAPLITRLYTPRDFGVFVIASSLALTFGAVAALRFESAIPLPGRDDDARGLVSLAATCCLVTTALVATLTWLFRHTLLDWFDADMTAGLLLAATAIGGVVGLYRVLNQWALRHQRYALSARRNALQSLVTVIVQLAAGVLGYVHGLLLGMGAGQTAGVVGLLGGPSLRVERSRPTFRSLVRRYRSFVLFLAPAGLINAAGVYVPVILFASFYGPVEAGLLGLTQRVLGIPMTLIGQAVAQVYLAELARATRNSSDVGPRLFVTASRRLLAVGAIIATTLLLFGPALFGVVFGAEWRASGQMAQALGLGLAAQLVASTLSQTMVVLERAGLQLAWDLLRLLTTCGAVTAAAQLGLGALECVWWLTGAMVVTYAISWELSRETIRGRRRSEPGALHN